MNNGDLSIGLTIPK